MHQAPPVAVRCNGGWAWRALQAGLAGLAAGVLSFWALRLAEQAAAPAALAATLAAAGSAWLAWRQAREPRRALAWDGQRWTVDGTAVEPAVMLDLGPALLLRLRPSAPGDGPDGIPVPAGSTPATAWLAVAAAEAGPAWPALRVALYARRAGAPAAAAPPSE